MDLKPVVIHKFIAEIVIEVCFTGEVAQPDRHLFGGAHLQLASWHSAILLGQTLRIRLRRAGGVDDKMDAVRAVACIRFVRSRSFYATPPS